MGTSLSGLTPATTFDGLLKVGDNDPLTADLKAISTGDGTDTILSLSNSALSIGGSVTANEVFAGTSGFTFLRTENNARAVLRTFAADGKASFYNAVKIGDSISPTAQLQVVGSGADNTTTSLLVQNSAGTELFKVQDDGDINMLPNLKTLTIGNRANNLGGQISISPNNQSAIAWQGSNGTLVISGRGKGIFLGDTPATPTARLHVKGSGDTDATTSLLVQDSNGADAFLVRDDKSAFFSGNLGVGRTVASARIHAMAAANNGTSRIFLGEASGGADRFAILDNGFTSIGHGAPTARAHIKGQGTTSATTALLVQNSAGTELMKVRDDGAVYVEGNNLIVKNSALLGYGTNRSVGIGTGSTIVGTSLHVVGKGNDATTTALLVQNSDGGDLLTLTDDGALQINSDATQRFTIADANGNASLNFRYNNIYTSGGNVLYIGGNSTVIQGGGSERLRTTPTGTTVKGSGATSATTALLVENSAGGARFRVRDDGSNFIGNFAQARYSLVVGAGQYPGASAVLQVDSTTQGFLPPRMTDAEKNAIATPAAGLMVYDTDANQMSYWNGGAWVNF